ncbi:hypothetical protein [Armatimonas sp.]|uniref:hypothetical protein n=1 Tax=Armatimonas sp. TaxID=1872638 RepID=UPI00374CD647
MKIINHIGATGTADYGRELLVASALSMGSRNPRTRVSCQNPAGKWIGIPEHDPLHAKAVAAARRGGWTGLGRWEGENRGGVKFIVMEDK